MISRRTFLKYSGIAAVSLGAGIAAGKIFPPGKKKQFSLSALVPGDENLISEVVKQFKVKSGAGCTPVILAEEKAKRIILKAYGQSYSSFPYTAETVSIKMIELPERAPGDLLLSDNINSIQIPEKYFDKDLSALRTKLKDRQAVYLLVADYVGQDFISSFIIPSKKNLVIENENGLMDKIDLSKSYKELNISGPQGITSVRVENNSAHVHSATCRNKICILSGNAAQTGDVIACAPNKIIIRIENT